jgi:CRISPR-associated endonuclease/helicase Cas3
MFGAQPDKYFSFLAGGHDVGKLEPLFQGGLLWRDHAAFQDVLGDLGLSDVSSSYINNFHHYDREDRRHLRHEAMSAVALAELGIPFAWCASISGHHGQYPVDKRDEELGEVPYYRQAVRTSDWQDAQDELVDALSSAIGINLAEYDVQKSFSGKDAPLIPLVTGLIILSDWLASDEKFINRLDRPTLDSNSFDSYLAERTQQAYAVVERELGVAPRQTVSFEGAFGFKPTRDVQKWALENQDADGLTVMAVPTGEGKTEAALWLQAKHQSGEGLAFALPTMATADAIFDRVNRFYRDSPALAKLAHSRSVLNAFYAASNINPQNICGGESEGGLSPGRWFSGRHRGLTAPVVVGTCDQLLATSLSHHFLPLRLASLANKHIVLDEVHTYDAYQHRLLVRLLGWMGYYHTRVTILSATLPKKRLVECFQAYESGWQRKNVVIDDLEGIYPGVTWTTPNGSHKQQALSARQEYSHSIDVQKVQSDKLNNELADMAHRAWHQSPHRVAVIVNTVGRSQAVMQKLRAITCRECSIREHLVLLHSRMTAHQRGDATDVVLFRAGKSGTDPILLVSTQIAEASLDVDFDILITDIAPTASLIQRMGRQWRHSGFFDGRWSHPDTVQYRDQSGPVVQIVVPVDKAGNLAEYAHLPYARAEIEKTLSKSSVLDAGRRTSIHIPNGVQRAVDDAIVTWEDLTDDDISESLIPKLESQLAKDTSRKGLAESAGLDVLKLCEARSLRTRFTSVFLHELTSGEIYSEERQTRITEYESAELLVVGGDLSHRYLCHESADYILSTTSIEVVKEILGHAIRVPSYYLDGVTKVKNDCAAPLLRDLIFVDAKEFTKHFLLDELGLRRLPHA